MYNIFLVYHIWETWHHSRYAQGAAVQGIYKIDASAISVHWLECFRAAAIITDISWGFKGYSVL